MRASRVARSPLLGEAGLLVGSSILALSCGELLLWKAAGRSNDIPALLLASLALAAVCAGTTLLASRFARRLVSVAIPLALCLQPFARHAIQKVAQGVGRPELAALGLGLLVAGIVAILGSNRTLRLGSTGVAGILILMNAIVVLQQRPPPPLASAVAHPDLVLLVMDTTRPDHLSVYGYPRGTSAALERFAVGARVYDDAWSVAPWTPPSHASMLTGLLPAQHGVGGSNPAPLPEGLLTLPAVLRAAGYRTAGFPANPNLMAPGWSRDFDVYRPPWFSGPHTLIPWLNRFLVDEGPPWLMRGTSARVFAHARDWWARSAGAPRFLFLNLIDPHDPYRPSDPNRRRFLPALSREEAFAVEQNPQHYHLEPGVDPSDREVIRSLYDAEIAAMDREIGGFLDWLDSRDELDSSVVVITSDHGERLGERGTLGHLLEMDPHVLRIPLLIRYPPELAPGRIARRVQLDGLPGYLLRLVGIEPPPTMARRVLEQDGSGVVVAQHRYFGWYVEQLRRRDPSFDGSPYRGDWTFVADDRFALVLRSEQGRYSHRLVALDDRDLERDVSEQFPETVSRLLAVARELPSYGVEGRPAAAEALDPAARERLRALGYLD
jgi:arylsulfatase A-like enzyme